MLRLRAVSHIFNKRRVSFKNYICVKLRGIGLALGAGGRCLGCIDWSNSPPAKLAMKARVGDLSAAHNRNS